VPARRPACRFVTRCRSHRLASPIRKRTYKANAFVIKRCASAIYAHRHTSQSGFATDMTGPLCAQRSFHIVISNERLGTSKLSLFESRQAKAFEISLLVLISNPRPHFHDPLEGYIRLETL